MIWFGVIFLCVLLVNLTLEKLIMNRTMTGRWFVRNLLICLGISLLLFGIRHFLTPGL
ncbi:hypothetical protein ITJ88_15795 [Exiguobacterium sp. TBG-PICH-001]|uniref:hypothetical protein n=1 Tax=Exiguobacterium abrahamii TaxID=2785532 RepID=UPI0018A7C2EB|nr:hypothetical protein [Exiguobacterium sp. TBG-PICH-001]MBF8154747.1 hypothetical protein [Exiguobacterium sp. TBG-PICH-001]